MNAAVSSLLTLFPSELMPHTWTELYSLLCISLSQQTWR